MLAQKLANEQKYTEMDKKKEREIEFRDILILFWIVRRQIECNNNSNDDNNKRWIITKSLYFQTKSDCAVDRLAGNMSNNQRDNVVLRS